jgi:hypothetical protein
MFSRNRGGPLLRRSSRRALELARSRWLHTRRTVWLDGRNRKARTDRRPLSCREPRSHLHALRPLWPFPDSRRREALSLDIRALAARRLFKATACACSGRLPSLRSPALHRGSTRAIPFDRSHAFASHPCHSTEAPPPVTELEVGLAALPRPRLQPELPLMSGEDTPHRLLQTDHPTRTLMDRRILERLPACFSAPPSRACFRSDRNPSESSRVAYALDGARRASVIACFVSPAVQQTGSRARW